MMSWVSDLFSGGVTKLADGIAGVADRFIETPDEKRAFTLQVEQLIQKRESEIEQTIRAELQAKERVLVAELNQGDNYTKRARPTVVYAGLFFIFFNYVIVPAVGTFLVGTPISAYPLPTEFWAAWGGICATWSIGRSTEKRGVQNRATQAITGNKHISLLG